VIRKEERWLIGLILLTIFVYLSSGTGSDLYYVFDGYLRAFGYLVTYLFVVSRLLFRLDEWWTPRTRAGTWGKRFLFGDPETRADTLSADVELGRGIFMLFFTLAVYSNLKVRIPFINQADGDPAFLAMDAPFRGLVVATEDWFRGNPAVSSFFGGIYMHGYRYMMILVFIVHLRRDTFTLRWLMNSVCFTYLIAILVTAAYPSMGPCFLEPGRFAFIEGPVKDAQRGLAGYYAFQLEQFTAGKPVKADIFSGIAAFPSLHVGHMIIMLVVALRAWRGYAWFMAVIATLTFIATIGFGWHYVVDGIGGALLAAGVTYVVGKRIAAWDKQRIPA
jgi:hypothetical protein